MINENRESCLHLSDEEIAKLIDGRVDPDTREGYWQHLSACPECFDVYTESIKSMENRESEKQPRRFFLIIARKKIFIPVLAALLLIFSFPHIWKAINPSEQSQQVSAMEKISVAHGARKELTLADGSLVILDAGSHFQYPQAFRGKTREVFLKGEGYFEVKPDKKKTFTVNAGHAAIKVLGTKFNVQAWPSSQKVEVAVIEGEVSLGACDADATSAVVISRGELSTLALNGQPSAPQDVDVEKHLGWLKREIAFHNTPLQQILTLLERWYDIHFFWDESVSVSDQLTLQIQNRPVDEIIELIADLMNLEYKREGKTVYLFTQKNNR